MKKNDSVARVATVLTAAVLLSGFGSSPAQAAHNTATSSSDAGAIVVKESLASGNDAFLYVPNSTSTGLRAAATPVLVVLSDKSVDATSAKQLAETSGMADIAKREQGVVAFLNPEQTNWSSTDAEALPALIDRYGDSSGQPYTQEGKRCAQDWTGQEKCLYPGARSRIYLFADGRGADFVSTNVVSGISIPTSSLDSSGNPIVQKWTPTAVWLSNTTERPAQPPTDVEIPAYLMNTSSAVSKDYESYNSVHGLFGTSERRAKPGGFQKDLVLDGYDRVVEHAISRWSNSNNVIENYTITDYAAAGIDVEHDFVDINGAPLEYFQYLPNTADKTNMPLMLVFHGGGNHAEYQMFATGWPDIAKEHGFMVVSVNQHVERSAADMVALLDHLEEKWPGIDKTRVYASGFSMGSEKTWNLSDLYPERFAGIAPMSGSFQPASNALGLPVPTIYFAGLDSPLPELPHQLCTFSGCGTRQPNNIDARLRHLFTQNNVTNAYTFDEAADPAWGVSPATAFTVQDEMFANVSVRVSEFPSTDGRVITALGAVAGAGHEVINAEARIAWQFLSKYSRNDDGSIRLQP